MNKSEIAEKAENEVRAWLVLNASNYVIPDGFSVGAKEEHNCKNSTDQWVDVLVRMLRDFLAIAESRSPEPEKPCQCVCHRVGLFGLMCCPCTRKALDELVNGKRTEPAIPSGAAQEVSPPIPEPCETDGHPVGWCCKHCYDGGYQAAMRLLAEGDTRELKAALKLVTEKFRQHFREGDDTLHWRDALDALAEAEKLLGLGSLKE